MATLFINDLAAIFKDGIDPLFEVSRYSERLASSNPSFDVMDVQVKAPETYTKFQIGQSMHHYLDAEQPDIIGISAFPW